MRLRWLAPAVLPAFAVLAALSDAPSAFAHAAPARVTPGDGAVVVKPPLEVVIIMTQDMARQAGTNDIDVLDSSGTEITTTAAAIDNANRRRLTVALPSSMQPGKYIARWKSLSADDGDPAGGEFSFDYDPTGVASPGKEVLQEDLLGPAATASAPPQAGSATSTTSYGGQWVLLTAVAIGAFVLGGGTTFLLVAKPPPEAAGARQRPRGRSRRRGR